MNEADLRLDGNAVAGLLTEVFAVEMTTAVGTCAHCGASNAIGTLPLSALLGQLRVDAPLLGGAAVVLRRSVAPVLQLPLVAPAAHRGSCGHQHDDREDRDHDRDDDAGCHPCSSLGMVPCGYPGDSCENDLVKGRSMSGPAPHPRFATALEDSGLDVDVRGFPESTRTAAEA